LIPKRAFTTFDGLLSALLLHDFFLYQSLIKKALITFLGPPGALG